MNALSDRINKLLRANGMNRRQLAEAVGVSAVAVTHWLNDGKYPSSYYICQIADVFGCSTDYLLGRTKE